MNRLHFFPWHRTGLALGLLFGMLVLTGCSGGTSLHPLKGKVTYKGNPVPVGEILFTPDSSKGVNGPQCVAEIKNGDYTTNPGQGIVGGAYKIRIFAYDGVPAKVEGEELPKGKPLFPAAYEASVDLPAMGGTHDIAITGTPDVKPGGGGATTSGDGL